MDASRMLSLVHAAQLELERQVPKGSDEAHTAGEWLVLVQQHVDQLRSRTERLILMESQYGLVESWPDAALEDWPDVGDALVKLMALLFAWNDARNWVTVEDMETYV